MVANKHRSLFEKATDDFILFFKENPEAPGYFKLLDVGGNTKVNPIPFDMRFRSIRMVRFSKPSPRRRKRPEKPCIHSALILRKEE